MTMTDPTLNMPSHLMGKKVASLQDAENVLDLLLVANPSTTTLDVKNQLRSNQFYCTQEMASYFMEKMFEDRENTGVANELVRHNNGTYFIYALTSTMSAAQSSGYAASVGASSANPGTALLGYSKTVVSPGGITTAAQIANLSTQPFNGSTAPIIADTTNVDLSTTDQDNWYCYDSTLQANSAVFDKGMTRSQARVQYGNLVSLPYDDVRACRVSSHKK